MQLHLLSRQLIKTICCSIFLLICYSQLVFSQQLSRSTISSVGAIHKSSNYYLSQTVGQSYLGNSNLNSNSITILSQGFQQGEISHTNASSLIELGVKVYPNPLQGLLTVENLKHRPIHHFEFSMYNIHGQEIRLKKNKSGPFSVEFDLGSLAKGTYTLNIMEKTQGYLSIVKIQKF